MADADRIIEINPASYDLISGPAPGGLPSDGGKVGDVLVFNGVRGEDNDMPYLWVAAKIISESTQPEGALLTARWSSFDPYTHEKCRWMRRKAK